jgi:hypothetical protein
MWLARTSDLTGRQTDGNAGQDTLLCDRTRTAD